MSDDRRTETTGPLQTHLFAMDVKHVVLLLRTECQKVGGPKQWARANGVSPAHVAEVLRGDVDPSPFILSFIGVERVVTYRHKDGTWSAAPNTSTTDELKAAVAGSPTAEEVIATLVEFGMSEEEVRIKVERWFQKNTGHRVTSAGLPLDWAERMREEWGPPQSTSLAAFARRWGVSTDVVRYAAKKIGLLESTT